jgi:hypothetical protein
MSSLPLPPGVPVLVGRPEVPLPEEISNAVAKAVVMVPGLAEAHLPQCFIRGVMKEPARVLAVVLTPDANHEETLTTLRKQLESVLPPERSFSVLTVSADSPTLEDVRNAECSILWTEHAPKLKRRAWKMPFVIPPGCKLLFSKPPRSLPGYQLRLITSLLTSIPGVAEAHLPNCYVPETMKSARPILVVVVRPDTDDRDVCAAVEKGLSAILRDDETLEIWTLPVTSSMLHPLRRTNCSVLQVRAG